MSNINSPGNMTPEQLMKLAASFGGKDAADPENCLLYTSDAADEL